MIDLLLAAGTVAFFLGLTALSRVLDRLGAGPYDSSSQLGDGGRR